MTTRRSTLDPEAVLRGRVPLDARSLCALIRSVNPSGLELPSAERERRYALKSRLQSLLVRRFEEEIEVVPDPAEGPDFVLLRHRPSGSVAGHARVPHLDDDARSWVQRVLDMEAVPAVPAPRPSSPGARAGVPAPRPSSPGARAAVPAPRPSSTGASGGAAVRFRDLPLEPGEDASLDELIGAGKRAVGEYDYDLARRLFSRALEETGGAPRPARHLLSLLVDQLGADTDALALVDGLDEAAAADPDVRGRLALAAARLGDRPRARALAKGLRDGVIAEVIVSLGTSAVTAGDLDVAAQDLREATVTDPSHPQIAMLEAAIEKASAARVGPLIERVLASLAAGRLDEAESVARELRAAGASAPGAKEALLAVEAHRRRARTTQLLEEASRALGEDLPEKAVGLLRQALLERPVEGAVVADLERLLAEAESRHRTVLDIAAADSALRLLGSVDVAEGLLAYVALSEGARARVRGASQLRALALLDRTGVTGQGSRARSVVAAIQALCRAEETLETDPEGALALLAEHERALENVPEASAAVKRGEALRKDRERAEARRRFEEARSLLDASGVRSLEDLPQSSPSEDGMRSIRQAAAMLGEATVRWLVEPERASALSLRAAAERIMERQDFKAHIRELLERFDLPGARSYLAARLASTHDGSTGPGGDVDPARTLDTLIQSMFHVRVAGEGAREMEASGLGRAILTHEAVPMPDPWGLTIHAHVNLSRILREDGRELIDMTTFGRLLVIRVIDMAARPHRLRTVLWFRLPQPFSLRGMEMNAETLLSTGHHGGILELGLPGFRVLAYRPGRIEPLGRGEDPVLALPRQVNGAAFADDLRTVWILDNKHSRLRGVEVETMRIVHEERTVGDRWRIDSVGDVPGTAFALIDGRDALELRGPDGKVLPGGRFELDAVLSSMAPYPGGGLFALVRRTDESFEAVRLQIGRPVERLLDIGPIPEFGVHGAATDPRSSRIFLLADSPEEDGSDRLLFAFDAGGESGVLRQIYRAPMSSRTMIVQDARTRLPSLLVVERGVFEVFPLGETPPELPEADLRPEIDVPSVLLHRTPCHNMSEERKAAVNRLVQAMPSHPARRRLLMDAALEKDDPMELLDLGRAINRAVGNQAGARLEARAMRHHEAHPMVRWWSASTDAAQGRWENVRGFLDGVAPTGLDPGTARHYDHMLGLALLHAGEHDEARRVLLRGLESPGACELSGLLAIAAPPGEEIPVEPSDRPLRDLVCLIAAADERLAAGDPEGAAALLDDVLVWEAGEVQSLARLARALLDLTESATPDRRYRAYFALSKLIDEHRTKGTNRSELFIRGRWSTEKLDALVVEAQAWIDRMLDG